MFGRDRAFLREFFCGSIHWSWPLLCNAMTSNLTVLSMLALAPPLPQPLPNFQTQLAGPGKGLTTPQELCLQTEVGEVSLRGHQRYCSLALPPTCRQAQTAARAGPHRLVALPTSRLSWAGILGSQKAQQRLHTTSHHGSPSPRQLL